MKTIREQEGFLWDSLLQPSSCKDRLLGREGSSFVDEM